MLEVASSNVLDQKQNNQSDSPVFAAIDLGTNNCRLMIARQDGNRIRVMETVSRIVRLGEGLSQAGNLSEEAMDRTINALKYCAERLAEYDIPESDRRFVATEACRKASNGEAFLARVREETGLELRLISNKDEAVLAFLGCAPLIRPGVQQAILIDVGGGSTECMLINLADPLNPKIRQCFSVPWGMMTLTEQFAQGAAGVTMEQYPEMLDFFSSELEKFENEHGVRAQLSNRETQMLCASGTITTIGAIHLGLEHYMRSRVDGTTLTDEEAGVAIRRIIEMPEGARGLHPCIGKERSDYVLAGCAIVEALMKTWPLGSVTIADRGVREGIIFSLFRKKR